MLRAGIKDNVVPGAATATVNIRLLPGDTAADLERHLVRVIDDPRVEVVRRLRFREPSRESALEGPAFEILSDTIRGVFPETIVTPYLVAGGTDARHYRDLSDAVYRFAPLSLDREDRRRLHGTNERVGVKDYVEAVHFYRALIRNLDALP
jgi:carboxypeptidase PM20D1